MVPGVAAIVNAVEDKVIVPALAANVEVEGTVSAPEILKLESVVAEEDADTVSPWNVGALPVVEIEAPFDKVMVPALGANAEVVERIPPTVAVVDAVIAAPMVRLLYVVFVIVAPELEYMTVEDEGVNVPPAVRLNGVLPPERVRVVEDRSKISLLALLLALPRVSTPDTVVFPPAVKVTGVASTAVPTPKFV